MIEKFQRDESGYEKWIRENPSGYVFNAFPGNDPKMRLIHPASCPHLRRPEDWGKRTKPYGKWCSRSLAGSARSAQR